MSARRTIASMTALATIGATAATTFGGPAAPASAQVEPCVQRIVVFNNSAFILSYALSDRDGTTTESTDEYPVTQFRSTDLTTTAYAEGDDVRPVVSAQSGGTQPADRFVSFCDNGQTATYTVTGTLNDIRVTLIDG
jgi:hypothetical protein